MRVSPSFALVSEQYSIDSSNYRCRVSGATGANDYTPTLTDGTGTSKQTRRRSDNYLIQVEISVTTADLYFPIEPRPLIVFVDCRVHLKTSQMIKDEELRTLLRKKGYRILEQQYDNYSGKKETNHTKKYSTTWDWISGSDR